jgi:8-amino-7-oxononanoate synthase
LREYQNDTRPKFIVTETVFGMDGDIAPLEEIAALAKKFNAFLYLDEAHATGVFGSDVCGCKIWIS